MKRSGSVYPRNFKFNIQKSNIVFHILKDVVVQLLSDSLQPHGLQCIRLPCPSLSPGVCSNSCPLSCWCYLTISPSVTSLCLLPLIIPSIRVSSNEQNLLIRWPKYWNFSMFLPTNIQSWFPLGLTGLISLQSKDSQNPSPVSQFKNINSSILSLL